MNNELKGGVNKVLIHIPDEEIYFEKRNRFDIDTSFNPANHVKGLGVVMAVPFKLQGFEYEDIVQELKVGDQVLVHYNEVIGDDGGNVIAEMDGKKIYACDYFNVYCRREKKEDPWQMVGGWILCDGYYRNDIQEIEYEDFITKKKVKAKAILTESGLVADVHVKRSTKVAVLVAIGTPMKDADVLDLVPGDVVIFRQDMDSEIEVDGKSYLIMRQEELYAKL